MKKQSLKVNSSNHSDEERKRKRGVYTLVELPEDVSLTLIYLSKKLGLTKRGLIEKIILLYLCSLEEAEEDVKK